MFGLLHVICLDVWDVPHVIRLIFAAVRRFPEVGWVLPLWVARELSQVGALERSLPGILARDPDSIQVEVVPICLCVPHHYLISAREPLLAVQTMAEMPDNAVSEDEVLFLEVRVQNYVQR